MEPSNKTATDVADTSRGSPQPPALQSDATESPSHRTPDYACDSHIHIFDNRFPALAGPPPPNFPVTAYRQVQQRMGTTRTVVVTPRAYVTNHRCTLDAIAQLGSKVTRGVAVVHPNVTDAELKTMADGGIRGIRFTVDKPADPITTIDMIEPLAQRVNALGWHVQIHMLAEQIVANADLLQRLAAPIVFDHMGRIAQPAGIDHAAFQVIGRLLDRGRTWIKLSANTFGQRRESVQPHLTEIAQAYIKIAPERVVWGSDWPHRSDNEMPDDKMLIDLVAQWAPDEPTRQRILVDNPERLYDFPKSG